jgi:hypothetical protein
MIGAWKSLVVISAGYGSLCEKVDFAVLFGFFFGFFSILRYLSDWIVISSFIVSLQQMSYSIILMVSCAEVSTNLGTGLIRKSTVIRGKMSIESRNNIEYTARYYSVLAPKQSPGSTRGSY